MFISVTGKPGSGKSAYAVKKIIDERDNYLNIYANINGLKLGGNLKALNFEELMLIVSNCKDIYDDRISQLGGDNDENIIDEPIVEYLLDIGFIVENPLYVEYLLKKEHRDNLSGFKLFILELFKPIYSVPQYKPTLIIIDEAQNHLPAKDRITGKDAKVDPVIAWWISYHRHLYMDVFLLSQTYQKIHTTYLRDVEYFLYAVPSDRQLFNTKFQYRHHTQTPFFKTNLVETISIKKDKKIFAMYDSGDKVRTQSIIRKYAIYLIGLLILVILMFSFAISYFTSGKKADNKKDFKNSTVHTVRRIDNNVSHVVSSSEISYDNLKYLSLLCMSNICINKQQHITLHIDDLKDFLKNTDSKYIRSKKLSQNLAKVYLLVSPSFKKLFQGAINEKSNKGFTLIN